MINNTSSDDIFETAELLGYQTFRCPRCDRPCATDTIPHCDWCGWDAELEEE